MNPFLKLTQPNNQALLDAMDVVAILSNGFPQQRAIITGGFVRDILSGVQPKDIDIVALPMPIDIQYRLDEFMAEQGYTHDYHTMSSGHILPTGVEGILTFTKEGALTIDIVVVNDIAQRLYMTTCNAAKVYINDKLEVYGTDSFVDFLNGTLMFYTGHGNWSLDYQNRVHSKYPSKFVITKEGDTAHNIKLLMKGV